MNKMDLSIKFPPHTLSLSVRCTQMCCMQISIKEYQAKGMKLIRFRRIVGQEFE